MLPDKVLNVDFSFKKLFAPLTTIKALHIIIIVGIIIFSNAIFNDFVMDDNPQIINNPVVHSIRNIPAFFSGSTFYNGAGHNLTGQYFKPLPATLFSVIYAIFGANNVPFHILQIIIFIINACFVYLVLKYFLRNSTALILSLVFLVHPINSEVAFYISDYQEVLMFFFGILSLWILLHFVSKKSIALAVLLLFFSLLSKETGVLFLIIAAVYIFLFKRKEFNVFFGFSALMLFIYCAVRVHAVGISQSTLPNSPIQTLGLTGRIWTMPAIYFYYLKTFIFPLDLATSYHWIYRHFDISHFLVPLIIDIFLLIIFLYFAVIFYKRSPGKYFRKYIFFGIWFLSGILFHLQFFPLDQTVAERWFYFPIVGLLAMTGIIYEAYHLKIRKKWILAGMLIIIIAALSIRTFIRSFDWRSNFILANHDTQVSKEAYNLENILSANYYFQGRCAEAKKHAERSIKLFPFVNNYLNLGVSYACLKDYKKAKEYYLKALQFGDYNLAYDNLAALSLDYGDPQENISFIENRALPKFPQDATLWLILARLEYRTGSKDKALEAIKQAYQFDQGPAVSGIYNAIINNQPL